MPKVKKPKRRVRYKDGITRADVRAHPDWAYLFGDNTQMRHRSGQAAEIADEPNGISVFVKRFPMTIPTAYFNGSAHDLYYLMSSLTDVARIADTGATIIIPAEGIGVGLSDLEARAPKLKFLIDAFLDALYDAENHVDPHK